MLGSLKKYAGMAAVGTVTVTGGATIAHTSGVLATGALLANADGTIDKSEGGSVTQLSASTDWLRPVTASPSIYQAMLTVVSGASPDSGDDIDTWLPLSSNRSWSVSTASGTVDAVWRLHIRRGSSGSALDTGDYTIDLLAN